VGADGWGGGVHLAVSNKETQERNNKMLRKFLKKQLKQKQERVSGQSDDFERKE